MKYPTKKQILAPPRPKYKKGLMSIISSWKNNFYKNWSTQPMNSKLWNLQILSETICNLEGVPRVIVFHGDINKYHPVRWGIELTEPYSVISLFHELAHHIFGPDELTACRWSVWLYQLRFRNNYNKLIWKKHILVRPIQRHLSQTTKQSPLKK